MTWLIYEITGSGAWSAIIFGVNRIPTVFLTPFAGPIVEEMDKKKTMLVMDLIRGACVGIIATTMILGCLNKWLLLGITLVISSAEAFRTPASQALLPDILEEGYYEKGISVNNSISSTVELMGTGVAGFIIAVIGGIIIEKMHMEKYVEEFIMKSSSVDISSPNLSKKERLQYAKEQVIETFKKVFPYILIGVGIGAIIHNWIPEIWIERVLGGNNPFGVILATIVGIPMYADIFGTIPVAEALLTKGALLGTVSTLSLPSLIMLKKAVKPKLLILFITICTLGIIIVGYLFNIFSFLLY